MSVFNKDVTYFFLLFCLLIIIALALFSQRQVEEKEVCNRNFDENNECQFFEVGDSLYAEELICYFTDRDCPTCILDVKKYSESIVNCPEVLFFTNKIDTLNIMTLTSIKMKNWAGIICSCHRSLRSSAFYHFANSAIFKAY
jgi:hypothetical protein